MTTSQEAPAETLSRTSELVSGAQRSRGSRRVWPILGFAVTAFLGVALALSVKQDANGDQFYSHTLAAWVTLHPHQDLGLLGSLIPALWDVPWFLLVERAPTWVVICYLGVLHSIPWFLSGRIAWSLLRDVPGRWRVTLTTLSAGFAIVAPATLSEFATTFGDLPTSILVLSAVLVLIDAQPSGTVGARRAIVAGALLGVAFALKLTNGPFVAAAAVALALGYSASGSRRLRTLVLFGSGTVLGAAASGSYLWVRYWRRFGNPIFPFVNDIFGSPYVDGNASVRDTRFVAKTPLDQLTLPWRMVTESGYPSELPGRDLRWAFIGSLALVITLVAARRRRSRSETEAAALPRGDVRFFVWFMCVSWLLWSVTFGAPRYFISIEMLGGIALVLMLRSLIASPLRVTAATLGLLAATAAAMVVPAYPSTPISKTTWYSFSAQSLAHQPDTMVVMPTAVTLNYTIAAFPDDAALVELWPFLEPSKGRASLRTQEVLRALNDHTGPVVAVVLPKDSAVSSRVATRTGFVQSPRCQRLRSTYYSPLMCLWTPLSDQEPDEQVP